MEDTRISQPLAQHRPKTLTHSTLSEDAPELITQLVLNLAKVFILRELLRR